MFQDDMYTAESVTEGNPDKTCDLIVDAVLDEVIGKDRFARVELDAMAARGLVLVSGELTTKSWVDITHIVRETLCDIGYCNPDIAFDAGNIAVLTVIEEQPGDLALAVDKRGAGNQGVFVGFATNEHEHLSFDTNYLPVPIFLAHMVARRLSELRHSGQYPWMYPDGQSQVTVRYKEGVPVRIDNAVVATHHHQDRKLEDVRAFLEEQVLDQVLAPTGLLDERTKLYPNPAGLFTVGGPMADVGVSGRKQIVDHYGTICRHGGAALSGKDPTKTDRAATYMARYIAKNVVVAGLADKCEIRLAYVIGREQPVTVQVATFGTGQLSDRKIAEVITERFDLSTAGIIEHLNLQRPIYRACACFGHAGRRDVKFTWEHLDCAEELKSLAGKE